MTNKEMKSKLVTITKYLIKDCRLLTEDFNEKANENLINPNRKNRDESLIAKGRILQCRDILDEVVEELGEEYYDKILDSIINEGNNRVL